MIFEGMVIAIYGMYLKMDPQVKAGYVTVLI